MGIGNYSSVDHRPRVMDRVANGPVPVFDISIRVTLNVAMVTQLVEVLDRASQSGIRFPKEAYAFYCQLGNFLDDEEG